MSEPRKPLIPLDDALASLLAQVTPLAGTQALATAEARGRVLAVDLVSPVDVPPADNAAIRPSARVVLPEPDTPQRPTTCMDGIRNEQEWTRRRPLPAPGGHKATWASM